MLELGAGTRRPGTPDRALGRPPAPSIPRPAPGALPGPTPRLRRPETSRSRNLESCRAPRLRGRAGSAPRTAPRGRPPPAYLSSFWKDWSPRSRSRKRYRGGKGSTSVSRSLILGLAVSRSTSPQPPSSAQGRLRAHASAPSVAGRPRGRAQPPAPRSPDAATATDQGGGGAGGTCRGRAGEGARPGWGSLEGGTDHSQVRAGSHSCPWSPLGLAWEPFPSLDPGQAGPSPPQPVPKQAAQPSFMVLAGLWPAGLLWTLKLCRAGLVNHQEAQRALVCSPLGPSRSGQAL